MKNMLCRLVLGALITSTSVSCTTTYDAYGYPQQTVDPGAAVLGAAAVGLLAYGLANSDNHRHYSCRRGSYYSNYQPHYRHRHHCHYSPY